MKIQPNFATLNAKTLNKNTFSPLTANKMQGSSEKLNIDCTEQRSLSRNGLKLNIMA